MNIVDFYKELSSLLADYRINPSSKNTKRIDDLVKEAKENGLDIDVNVDKLKIAALLSVYQ